VTQSRSYPCEGFAPPNELTPGVTARWPVFTWTREAGVVVAAGLICAGAQRVAVTLWLGPAYLSPILLDCS
jgi:hypothetical protein